VANSIALSTQDLGHLLELTEAIAHEPDGERFAGQLLSCLCRLIGCDDVTYSDIDAGARRSHAYVDLNEDDAGCNGDDAGCDRYDETETPFWQHYWSCEPCSYRDATGAFVAAFTGAAPWQPSLTPWGAVRNGIALRRAS
jgi:hypothetical protein